MRQKKKILEHAKPIDQNPWGNPLGYIGFGTIGCFPCRVDWLSGRFPCRALK